MWFDYWTSAYCSVNAEIIYCAVLIWPFVKKQCSQKVYVKQTLCEIKLSQNINLFQTQW